jgi:hypothetical protein
MKSNKMQLDKIKGCKCVYEKSSLGVSYLIRACKKHKKTFYPNIINAMSRAQENIVKSQPIK